tara:strand:+ start:2507 stop:3481 length:975 start_codon:yes stop_codon:yes gene_type:complete
VLLLLAIPAFLLVTSGGNRSFRSEVTLSSTGQNQLTAPFQLKQGWFGAPRIALRVRQPVNTSSVVNVELLNEQNEVALSFYKDTWRETGIWSEGGESGTWDEQDTALSTEFRPGESATFRLRLSLDDFMTTGRAGSGQTTAPGQAVPILVEIYSNQLNSGLLFGTIVVLLMGFGVYWWYEYAPKHVLRSFTRNETSTALADSFPDEAMLEVRMRARYEEPDNPSHSASQTAFYCPVSLTISDAWGANLIVRRESLLLNAESGEDAKGFRGNHNVYFKLKGTKRLRFRVEVPEQLDRGVIELDNLDLTVTELTRTMSAQTFEELA